MNGSLSSPKRVLAIGASPRQHGNTDILLEWIGQGVAAAGGVATTIQLRQYQVQPCTGCERCRRDKICTGQYDAMQLLYPQIEAAAALVLASPTHHYNVTAWMKAFIDRLYCYYDFSDHRPRRWTSRLAGRSRTALVVTVAEQPDPADVGFALEAMQLPLEALGFKVVDKLAVQPFFDRGAVRRDPDLAQRFQTAGRNLVVGACAQDVQPG